MRRLLLVIGLAAGLCAGECAAVPDRAPRMEPAPDQLPTIALDQLAKEGGVLFGDWLVCRNIDENGLIIIHRQSKLAIYLPWASNGWVNYRTSDGVSYVLWSRGGADPQQRNYYLDKLLAQPPPARLAAGKHTFQSWTVTVNDDVIDFHCSSMNCRMSVQRHASDFTHNGRTIGNVKMN
jgi:hypothetical protein